MTTAQRVATVVLAAAAIFAGAGQAEQPALSLTTQNVAQVGDEVRLPGLHIVGGADKYVEATGKISITNDILEFIAVEPQSHDYESRDYESLVTLDCRPSALKAGLLLIGCEGGMSNGSPLNIEIEWQDNGQSKKFPVESLIIDRTTGKAPKSLPFSLLLVGEDLFTSNQIFHADIEHAHIALWWQPAILINVRSDFGNPYHNQDQGFIANSKIVPPVGTPIKLIFHKRD